MSWEWLSLKPQYHAVRTWVQFYLISDYCCWFVHTETISTTDNSNNSSQDWMLCRLHQTTSRSKANTCHYMEGKCPSNLYKLYLYLASNKSVSVVHIAPRIQIQEHFWTGCWTKNLFLNQFCLFCFSYKKTFCFFPFKRDKTIWEVTHNIC